MSSILIVEDELNIRRMVSIALNAEGYKTIESSSVRDGLRHALDLKPELIILDLGLPDGDGQEVLTRIRQTSSVPILVLSARHTENDKVKLLMSGANDYVSKPFSIRELIARIKVLLRDITPMLPEAKPVRRFPNLLIDVNEGYLEMHGIKIPLSPKELQLLDILTREPGVFVSQKMLMRAIWGNYNSDDTHYIRILVSHVRKKLNASKDKRCRIETSTGHGYRFVASEAE
jgi:two-component system KDP operon response regulator KdpE